MAHCYMLFKNMPKSHNREPGDCSEEAANELLGDLVFQFCQAIGLDWQPPAKLRCAALQYLEMVEGSLVSEGERVRALAPIIARKFNLNREAVQSLWNEAASHRFFFDPRAKAEVTKLFDEDDKVRFSRWIEEKALPARIIEWFQPVKPPDVIDALHTQLKNAKINRSDARKGVQKERRQAILRSLFGTWLYEITDTLAARAYFIGGRANQVPSSYFKLLQRDYSSVLDRKCGGVVSSIPADWWSKHTPCSIRDLVLGLIKESYGRLSNHSYLGIYFDLSVPEHHQGAVWELIGDATLYAERHLSTKLEKGFFRPAEIESQTKEYIKLLAGDAGDFEQFQYGFVFKDCIVNCAEPLGRDGDDSSAKSAFLLFEKHQADETVIPCPACWSRDIGGNSYPVFGVRSWECHNPLCPERSAFDRGNRFSVMSILRNEASNDERALIDEECLRDWKLDVVASRTSRDFLEMFVRHYSLPDDVILCLNWEDAPSFCWDRTLESRRMSPVAKRAKKTRSLFEQSAFFSRYLNVETLPEDGPLDSIQDSPSWLQLFRGSCLSVLQGLPENSIDGAVTSPPYYNARDYSVWPNVYSYLYDMKVASEGVLRVLKPGGYYLFNIFDYFDNDNIMAFSALGKRRIVLGAYMMQIFRQCGFKILGNIVWHKGEIEGKRNYNHGNRAPFFQLPLNTWEHILVLRKPGREIRKLKFPDVIYRRPVLKWVKGKNRHGHSAPFPESIPDLLCSKLPEGSTILDPFGGSLTTAITARRRNQKAVAIELHESYCKLGLKRIQEDGYTLPLFESV